MRKSLNFTGRKEIFPEDIFIEARKEKNELYVTFASDIDLRSHYPDEAALVLELAAAGVNTHLEAMGTVGKPDYLTNKALKELKEAKSLQVTFRVVDNEGKILGQMHKLSVKLSGDLGLEKHGILGVAISPEPMKTIWRLDWDEDMPVLYMNRDLDGAIELVQTVSFQAQVLPEIVKIIAIKQIEMESADGANPKWKKFLNKMLSRLAETSSLEDLAELHNLNNRQEIQQIVDQLGDYFAGKNRFLEKFLDDDEGRVRE